MTSWGVNTGDDKSSCTWNIGNGAPWDWLLRESQDNARELGHGTCVAGIACAASNNDPDIYVPPPAYNPDQHLQVTDFCGITRSNMFIPFAMKARASGNSFKTSKCPIVNALLVLGCVKGRLSGTSASAPHVSAVAALMCSRFPTLTPSQVKARIENRGWTLPHSGPQPFLPCKGLDAYNSLLP
ncbi:MAG: S8/S53 family peptidase [bacterium]